MSYLPPGTVPFSTVLARLAETWMPDAWGSAPADERAVLEGAELGAWRHGQALRSGSLAATTYDRLCPMLADGRLPTMLHVKVGPPRVISPGSWQSARADDVVALLAGHVGFVLDDGTVERSAVLVTENALIALTEGRHVPGPVANYAAAASVAEVNRVNPGDAPKRHDDVAFIIIAARIAFEDRPPNQAPLVAAALEAYAATMPAGSEPPSEAWAKRLVRRLWVGLELERTDTRRAG